MKKVGKWAYEISCPLCFNIYVAGYDEVYVNKDSDIPYFHCPECDRNINLKVDDTMYLRSVKILNKRRVNDDEE